MKTFFKMWLGIGLIAIGVGAAVLVVAVASGARFEDFPSYSYQESFVDVDRIDMDIEYGRVKIVQGDEFSIDAKNLPNEGLEAYVSDGTWVIRESSENYFNVFGWNISAKHIFNWNDNFTPRITITLPRDFIAERITLVVGAGDVDAKEISAEEGDFNVSAGRLTIDELLISVESKFTVAAGQMKLNQINAKNITVDCGVGEVVINGKITGDNEISCSIGNVVLNLDGDKDDYSYDVSSSIGNVTIDNNSYHNISSQIINNSDAENGFTLDCEIGNITVDFK